MADEIDVKVTATTQPLAEGMKRASKDVGDGLDDIRAAFRRVDEQLEAHARHVDAWGQQTRTALDDTGGAMGSWVIKWNQGLDLAGKAARVFESAWDATMGRVIERGEALDDLAKRTATPVEQLSAISFAADQAGIDLASLTNGYRALSRNITEAATTGTDANKLFTEQLGFTRQELEALQSMRPHEAILAVGKALNEYEDGAGKAAVAQQLFGRSFEPILQMLRDTPGEFERNVALAERLGLVMSGETAAAAGQLTDSYAALRAAADGFFSQVLGDTGLLKDLGAMVDETTDRIVDFREGLSPEELTAIRTQVYDLALAFKEVGGALLTIITRAGQAASSILSIARSWRESREAEGDLIAAQTVLQAKLAAAGVTSQSAPRLTGEVSGNRIAPDFPPEEVGPQPSSVAAFVGPDVPTSEPNMGPQPVKTKGQLEVPDAGAGKAASSAAAKARQEEFQAILREQQQALAAEKTNAESRLAIVMDFSDRIKAQFGGESEEFDRQKLVQITAEEQAQQQRDRLAQIALDAQRDAGLAALDEERKVIEFRRDMGIIANDEAIDQLRDLVRRRLEILREAADAEMAANPNDPVKQAEIKTGLAGDEENGSAEDAELLREKQKELREDFEQLFGGIAQAGDRMINGLLQGTTRWQVAMRNMGRTVLTQFSGMVLQMVAKWAAGKAATLLISTTTEEKEVAVSLWGALQKRAITAATTAKAILAAASEAAAWAYKACVEAFGWPGIIIGAALAAVTFAAVAAYQVSAEGGMADVPVDGTIATLHKQEMVLPASLANPIRAMAAGMTGGARSPAFGGLDVDRALLARLNARELLPPSDLAESVRRMATPGEDAGGVHHHYGPMTINAVDARSVREMMKDRTIAREFARGAQNQAKLERR